MKIFICLFCCFILNGCMLVEECVDGNYRSTDDAALIVSVCDGKWRMIRCCESGRVQARLEQFGTASVSDGFLILDCVWDGRVKTRRDERIIYYFKISGSMIEANRIEYYNGTALAHVQVLGNVIYNKICFEIPEVDDSFLPL